MAELIRESQITTTTTIAAAVRATKRLMTRAYSFLKEVNVFVFGPVPNMIKQPTCD